MTKLLNFYIKRPLLYDLLICFILVVMVQLIESPGNTITAAKAESSFSDIVNTSISLAGFILAALTIIVTFKDNISHKENSSEKPKVEMSGLELLFSSKHYKRIVGVFSWAAFIFVLLFLVYSLLKLFIDKIPSIYYLELVICGIVLITMTIFRSLLILYKVIKLQIAK